MSSTILQYLHKHTLLNIALIAILLFVFQADRAVAQAPLPQQKISPVQLSKPLPDVLPGVDPDMIVRWTMRDAIAAALERNLDIEVERHSVRQAEFDLITARGVSDPLTTSTISYESQKSPNTFAFSGSDQNFTQNSTLVYNFGLSQYFAGTGGRYEITFNNERTTSNTSLYSPLYNPILTATWTQPLLKNFRTDDNRRQISIAKKNLDLSDAQFRQQAIEIIARVQRAYWDLALAWRDEEIRREAVRLAETQLKNNERQAEVGTLAPIDVVSAATQLESRRQDVLQAMAAVAQAENALKNLTIESPHSDLWKTRIITVEKFEIDPTSLPLEDALRLAYANRPELKQSLLRREINEIETKFFRNQTKPQVDFFASYSLTGVGGQPANPDSGVPAFVGGYRTALGNLFSNDFPTWRVGVNFSFPLRNRTAEGELGRALETGRQLEVQERRQMQNIEAEVRNAYQSLEAARLRVDAARSAREFAETQLAGEEKKFAAGLSTTFLVLTRQNDLSQARGIELRAQTDYHKATTELQRAISTILSDNSIKIKKIARQGSALSLTE
jgi:outer membrane protein